MHCIKLLPKMRLGSITLILRPKSRVCNLGEGGKAWRITNAPWLNPPKKFKRVSSIGKVMASIFWDNQIVIMVDYLEEVLTINGAYYAEEPRRLHQEIVKTKKRTVDLRCSALAR